MSTIFCVGIGGIGLSGLARILHAQGFSVHGSDAHASAITDALMQEGIPVAIGHVAENVPQSCERVIYSLAVSPDTPELIAARQRGIRVQSYPEAVGEFSTTRQTIAIAGTHGKTTTTAMTALALIAGNVDPTVLVGSLVTPFGHKNVHLGKGPFVLEACEYQRAFLNYHPSILVITNIEPDHLDYYKDAADYIAAFHTFVGQLAPGGKLIVNADDSGARSISGISPDALTISVRDPSAHYFLSDDGVLFKKGQRIDGRLHLRVLGRHNRSNALLAFAVADQIGVPSGKILQSLSAFSGTWRRFDYKGSLNGAPVYDDYGHHPTEIKATLQAARERFPDQRLICVFQPHQHSRTRFLWNQFLTAFADADVVVVPNIYAARDSAVDQAEVTAERFVVALQKNHPIVHFGNGLAKTAQLLQEMVTAKDVVLTMGAGDVTTLAQMLLLQP